MTIAEAIPMEVVEAPTTKKEKKSKKSKKTITAETDAPKETEDPTPSTKKEKKSKKSKNADADETIMNNKKDKNDITAKENTTENTEKAADADQTSNKRKIQAEHEDAPEKKKPKKSFWKKGRDGEKNRPKKIDKVTDNIEDKKPTEEETNADDNKQKFPHPEGDKKKKKVSKWKKEPQQAPEKKENLTIFIGGLPYSAKEETVKQDFAACGEIASFRFVTDKETGRPKGLCFIEYTDSESVQKALEKNDSEYNGGSEWPRQIFVRMASEDKVQNPKGKGKKGEGKKGKKGKGKGEIKQPGEKPEGCTSVFVKNLSYSTTEACLWKLFEDCGEVRKITVLSDKETGESKGAAFVDFAGESGVDEAIKKCNTEFQGRWIFVDYSGGKKGKGKGSSSKGSSEDAAAKNAREGAIVEATGEKKEFDSDSD